MIWGFKEISAFSEMPFFAAMFQRQSPETTVYHFFSDVGVVFAGAAPPDGEDSFVRAALYSSKHSQNSKA